MAHPFVVGPGASKRRQASATPPPLKERIAALRLVPRLIRLVWETHRRLHGRDDRAPRSCARSFPSRTCGSRSSSSTKWSCSRAPAVRPATCGCSSRSRWRPSSAASSSARASGLVESLLGDLFTNRISIRIMEHAATLDLHQFEDPGSTITSSARGRGRPAASRCSRSCWAWDRACSRSRRSASRWPRRRRGSSCCSSSPCCRASSARRTSRRSSYCPAFRRTPQRRQLDYVRYVGASDQTAKEVQLVRPRARG